MKKLLLLALVVIGGVMSANAGSDVYLRSNINATSENGWLTWDGSFDQLTDYKFENLGWQESESVDKYTFEVTSAMLNGNDLYFRVQQNGDNMPQICPHNQDYSGSEDYTFIINDGKSTGEYECWSNSSSTTGTGSKFIVEHTKIKADLYKITVTVAYADWGRTFKTKVEIVSMPATVSSLGYSTFSCDRALDLDNASTGLTAYKASVSEGKVVLTKATGKVEAGTGLLLAGTTGTIPVVETSAASALDGNLLHGAVTETNIAASTEGAYHYFLAGTTTDNIGFYNLASAADCAAGKAYLETTTELTSDPASSRVSWIFEDEPTGIQKVQAQSENCGSVFNLQGRRVSQPTKGLYIVNGKKVIK